MEKVLELNVQKSFQHENNQWITIDEVLEQIGQIGKFQIFVLILFSLLYMPPAFQAFNIVFLADSPKWQCTGISQECNSTNLFSADNDKRCKLNRSSWKYSKPDSYSIVTQFDLICKRDSYAYLANSALFLGEIIGTILIGWLSDRYGRKKVLIPAYIGLILFSFTGSFSTNIFLFIFLRGLVGICFGGVLLSNMVLSVELVLAERRALAGLVIWNMWTLGLFIMTLFAWLLEDWRKLSMILSAPFLIFALGGCCIPESVRWLRTKNHLHEAEAILRKVAKINRSSYPEGKKLIPIHDSEIARGSYKDLFKGWIMLRKAIAVASMWFTNDFIYYAITIAAGNFTGNLYHDFMFICSVDFPANLVSIYVINRIGRKRGAIAGYSVTCLCLVSYALMQIFGIEILPIRVTIAMIAKFSSLLTWLTVQIWTGELYPTAIRSRAMAFFFLMGVSGGAASPWLSQFTRQFWAPLPFLIMGCAPVVPLLFCFTLKETKGLIVVDSLLETEKLNKDDKKTDCDADLSVYENVRLAENERSAIFQTD
ncbi:organic cation transporter-like protein isoform X3 [Hydra vulgaris]|uniref:Organic cation transporter-like protein isoform X3 n=1 Tax=Hydra vulgaris TaxID=6087 RepID=A0ABM4CJC3_HYDVU